LSLGREARFVAAGQLGAAVISLAAIRIITAVLSPEVFGLAVLLLAALSLARGLFVAPLLAGQLRYDPRAVAQQTVRGLYAAIVRLGVVALIAAALVSFCLALVFRLYPSRNVAPWLVLAFACWLFTDALVSLCFNVLNARRLQGRLCVLRVADSFVRPAGAILLVVAVSSSALVYVAGQALGVAVLLLAVGAALLRNAKRSAMPLLPRSSSSQSEAAWRARLLTYGWPLVPVAVLSWTLHLADRFVLNAFHDSATVGVYSASYALASQPFLMLSSALTLFLRPHLFEAVEQGDGGDERVLYVRREWMKWLAILGAAGIALIALLRNQIGLLFLAPAYRGATGLLVVIGVAHLLLALGQLAENHLFALEETRRVLRTSVWSTIASMLAAFALIPRFAAYGAAWSTLVGLGVYAGLMWLPQAAKVK